MVSLFFKNFRKSFIVAFLGYVKGQIAGLLITAGGRGAEDHLARIELQLADALNDRQVLATRLAEYERREVV